VDSSKNTVPICPFNGQSCAGVVRNIDRFYNGGNGADASDTPGDRSRWFAECLVRHIIYSEKGLIDAVDLTGLVERFGRPGTTPNPADYSLVTTGGRPYLSGGENSLHRVIPTIDTNNPWVYSVLPRPYLEEEGGG